MKKIHLLIAVSIVFLVGFASYRTTLAFFGDTGTSVDNTFAAAEVFPTGSEEELPTMTSSPSPTITTTPTISPTPIIISPGDIVINEVFIHGGNSTEWIELYNKTAFPIDLSGWAIGDNNTSDTFPSISPIPSNGYAVIVGSGSTILATIPGSAIVIQLSNDIGNNLTNSDRLSLAAPSIGFVDTMNYGIDTAFFTPPIATPSAGQSMSRNPNGTDTNTAVDWILDGTPSIGIAN